MSLCLEVECKNEADSYLIFEKIHWQMDQNLGPETNPTITPIMAVLIGSPICFDQKPGASDLL